MNKNKLYNVLFPFWMIMLFPQIWFIVIPGNFIIDSIVFLVALTVLKLQDKKQWYKKYILKVFLFGMLSDIIGASLMFLMIVIELSSMGDELYMTVPTLVFTAFIIFLFNYCFTFARIDKKIRLKLSLTFAIATAPYTFLVPSSLIY